LDKKEGMTRFSTEDALVWRNWRFTWHLWAL